jgi:hypothetical protein
VEQGEPPYTIYNIQYMTGVNSAHDDQQFRSMATSLTGGRVYTRWRQNNRYRAKLSPRNSQRGLKRLQQFCD